MKVLVSTFGGDGGKSGISQYIIHLMRAFPKVAPGAHFDVLVFEGEEDLYVTDPERMTAITVGGHLRGAMKNLLWQQFAIPRICAKGNYDLLFVPAGNRRMPYRVPCPSVGTFHDLAALHVPGKYDFTHTVYNRYVLPALVRRLSRVISISEFTKKDLVGHIRVPEERISVILEAADTSLYYPRDKKESARRVADTIGIQEPYILYISRIEHPGKNHVRLIRAFERLKEKEGLPHKLVLAGSDWHGAEEVHREAEACKAANDIVFTGFVDQETIPDLYCAADVFVFPSLFEGFGLPILEAMASGVPVACANTSSLPEVAGEAALLFSPDDEAAIENALRKLLTDEGEGERFARLGLERAQTFSWEKVATETMAAFHQACEEAST